MTTDRLCIIVLALALIANSIGDLFVAKHIFGQSADILDCIEKPECRGMDEEPEQQSMPMPPAKRQQVIRT